MVNRYGLWYNDAYLCQRGDCRRWPEGRIPASKPRSRGLAQDRRLVAGGDTVRRIAVIIGLVVVFFFVGLVGWRIADGRQATRAEFLMGTYIEARAYGFRASKALDQVYTRLAEIERKLTINQPGSEIDAVNAAAGQSPVKVSGDTFAVVKKALSYGSLTGGRFDLTIQPIVALWRIGFPDARVPAPEEIQSALPLVGYQGVQLDEERQTIYLQKPGSGIDLGGIAKGYAADEAVAILRRNGIKSGLLSLGGNVYVIGNKPDGTPWRIGVQDPVSERDTYLGVIEIADSTLVTSGAYERYLEVGGKRYHHIIDPQTGYPAESDLISTTIVSKSSIDADALSTSLFVLGREQGLELAKRLGVEAIVVDKERRVYMTDGLKGRFTLTSRDYQMAEE